MWAPRGPTRSELAGETALRHGSRFVKKKIREHPAKAVQRAESKYIKATADHQFCVAAQEHPELGQNAWKRFWQKRQYHKQARQTAGAGAAKAAKQTAAATEKAGARRWASSSGIPWGCSWPWPVCSCSLSCSPVRPPW